MTMRMKSRMNLISSLIPFGIPRKKPMAEQSTYSFGKILGACHHV
jgi:hypothetical protein